MPVNDGGTDHNAPIGGDQDSQNQGDIKAHFLRDAFEKAQRGTKNEMHQKRDPRRKTDRRGNTRISGDMQGNIQIIPCFYAKQFFKQEPHAHFPEQNEHKHHRAINNHPQRMIAFGIFGENALFENAHFRGSPEHEIQDKNPEPVSSQKGKELMSRIQHPDRNETE